MSKQTSPRRRPTSARPARHRFRPALEAVEDRLLLSGTYTVVNLNDIGAGSGGSGDLRYCIAQANLNGGGTINFASNVSGTIVLNDDLPSFGQNITINGTGESLIPRDPDDPTISIAQDPVDVQSGATVSISSLEFRGGTLVPFDAYQSFNTDNAITNRGTLTLTNCTVSGFTGFVYGGIANFGNLNVVDCTFSGDSNSYNALAGGALYNSGTTTVTDSTFADNTSASIGNAGTLTVTGSTFSGNSGSLAYDNIGGGIYNNGST